MTRQTGSSSFLFRRVPGRAGRLGPSLAAALALPAALGGLLLGGCVTTDEGRRMQEQIDQLLEKSKKTEVGGAELATKVQQQNEELRRLLDEAKRLTTTLADASQKAERAQSDLQAVQGKFDDMQRQLDALQKSFTEYRAQSDTKLEQLVNATTVAKAPPLPDNPEAMFAEGQRKFVAGQWNDSRRVFDAFVNRYPSDQRASKAQFKNDASEQIKELTKKAKDKGACQS